MSWEIAQRRRSLEVWCDPKEQETQRPPLHHQGDIDKMEGHELANPLLWAYQEHGR